RSGYARSFRSLEDEAARAARVHARERAALQLGERRGESTPGSPCPRSCRTLEDEDARAARVHAREEEVVQRAALPGADGANPRGERGACAPALLAERRAGALRHLRRARARMRRA